MASKPKPIFRFGWCELSDGKEHPEISVEIDGEVWTFFPGQALLILQCLAWNLDAVLEVLPLKPRQRKRDDIGIDPDKRRVRVTKAPPIEDQPDPSTIFGGEKARLAAQRRVEARKAKRRGGKG